MHRRPEAAAAARGVEEAGRASTTHTTSRVERAEVAAAAAGGTVHAGRQMRLAVIAAAAAGGVSGRPREAPRRLPPRRRLPHRRRQLRRLLLLRRRSNPGLELSRMTVGNVRRLPRRRPKRQGFAGGGVAVPGCNCDGRVSWWQRRRGHGVLGVDDGRAARRRDGMCMCGRRCGRRVPGRDVFGSWRVVVVSCLCVCGGAGACLCLRASASVCACVRVCACGAVQVCVPAFLHACVCVFVRVAA